MRTLGRNRTDSLELLLDTVCSMFGAILLIAILVALQAQTGTVESSSKQAGVEMIRRKIATADADLAQVRELRARMTLPPDPAAATLAVEKEQLAAAVDAARAQRDRVSTDSREEGEWQAVDFSGEARKLSAALRALDREREQVANALRAQEQNAARLRGRVTEIDAQIETVKGARLVKLRFPKERAQTRKSFPIIFRYGKVYPLYDDRQERNTASIQWKDLGDRRATNPIAGAGWDSSSPTLPRLLSRLRSSELYLAFFVYPDSFASFRQVRELAVASGWEFGLELIGADETMTWGSSGTTPPPL